MGTSGKNSDKASNQSMFSWTLALVVGQVGCLTIIIIFAALFLGIWLDNMFDTKPIFTVGLIIASIPITLVAMLLVVRTGTSRLTNEDQRTNQITDEEREVSE